MDQEATKNFYQSLLQPDEVVLWHGQPGPGKLPIRARIPMLFALSWLGISLLWEVLVIVLAGFPMALFGIPFVLIGLFVLFGAIKHIGQLKGRIAYAITDQRLLVQEGNRIRTFTPEMLPPMQIRMNRDGTGSIFFSEVHYSVRHGRQNRHLCSLENIPDLQRAQSALTTMLSGA